MARTKRTKVGHTVEAGTVTITNLSPQLCRIVQGVKVSLPDGTVEPRELGVHTINSGVHIIPLKTNLFDQGTIVSWTLGTDQYGVLWRSDHNAVWQENGLLQDRWMLSEQWQIEVTPSGTYYLGSDPKNMPLTEGQCKIVEGLFMTGVTKPAPYEQLWPTVREQLVGNEEEFGPVPEKLIDAYCCFRHLHRVSLPNWQNDYRSFEENANSNKDWVSDVYIEKQATPGGRAQIDVYWRALDRQPGGNTDVHVICYTFDCATRTVSVRTFANWDGEVERREYTPARLLAAIQVMDTDSIFATFLESLRMLGPGDSECTVLDTISEDPEEYDTEWSSHEIIVRLPLPWSPSVHWRFPLEYQQCTRQFQETNRKKFGFPPEVVQNILEFAAPVVYLPVIRLHQRCVLGPQWRAYDSLQQDPEEPPSVIQQAALNTTRDLIGMGRVNTWTDAGDAADPCQAQKDQPDRSGMITDDSCKEYFPCTMQPFYFDFPARNVAGAQTKGTSAEWC